jgi:Tfp pilus assembly protein PilZ
MPEPHERRRYPRAEVRWPAIMQEVHWPTDSVIENVSFGGAFIRCRMPPRVNTVFEIVIDVPEIERPLEITAEVVWSRSCGLDDELAPRGIGIQFKDIRW